MESTIANWLEEFNLEWEPNERDAWVVDAQRWICKINGVLQCKIDLDTNGEVTGVHVIAGMDREPRHIVRDVESLLKARLGLDVYYKKIGIVQVLDNGPAGSDEPSDAVLTPGFQVGSGPEVIPASSFDSASEEITPQSSFDDPQPTTDSLTLGDAQPAVLLAEELAPRLVCNGVGTMASDQTVRAEVILQAGEVEARGTCDGPNSFGSEVDLVARATIDAVGQLLDEQIILHLNDVRQELMGGSQVILAAVDLVEGRRNETLFGACGCEHNRQQAVVYAVLDALNRRLSFFAFKSAAPLSDEAKA